MNYFRTLHVGSLIVVIGCLAGCSVPADNKPGASTERQPESASKPETSESERSTKVAPGGKSTSEQSEATKTLEPFTPPPLEELNKTAEWVDRPVIDALQLLRATEATEKPLTTVAKALELKNSSAENNAKILSALGRLPPSDGDVNWEAAINRRTAGELNSTNPILSSSVIEFDVSSLTGFGLFSFDWNLEPFASKDSVVSWQSSKDQMYDKVVMRDDLTWSNGKPITAHDVAFSFRVIMDPRVPAYAQRSGTDKLRWVHAYDDRTVVFFHKEALVTNVWNCSYSIIPQHIYEKSLEEDPTLQNSPYHVSLENKPVSGGAYVVTERSRGQSVLLERREDYYMFKGKQVRDKPYFKTVRFRILTDSNTALLAIKKGDIDEAELTAEQWTTQTESDDYYERNTKATAPEWLEYHFMWNLKSPWFSDKRVRKAMSFAYDHEYLINELCYGLYQPSTGTFAPNSWMAPGDLKPYKQDLDQAEELLDEAGWNDSDGDGVRDKVIDGKKVDFEFSVLTRGDDLPLAICTLLKENLQQIGVKCNVKPLEFAALIDRVQKKNFDASYGGWGTGSDPDTSVNIWGTGEGRNYVSYSNPEVDKLFEQGRKEPDKTKRGAIYARIHRILYEDQPYTWLFYRNAFYGFNKELRGYRFSPRGPFHYSPGFSSIWRVAP